MMIVVAIVVCGLCAGAIFSALKFFKRQAAVSVGAERDKITAEIEKVTSEIDNLLQYSQSFVSQGQYNSINSKLLEVQDAFEKEKTNLAELEQRLGSSQEQVEGKESTQQELKTSKEEDEIKLDELLGKYQEISDEAVALEQQLAESMKNLDQILETATLTDDQRAVLTELSEALGAAGSTLRTLITEYQTVNERLELLKEQHEDLEEEYTKLVEQQLGE